MTRTHHSARKHERPSIEELRARYTYDPETGELHGLRKRNIGKPTAAGYLATTVRIGGVAHFITVHRIAYALMTNTWPHIVDHANRNRLDNRWSNLRNATATQNAANTDRNKKARHICRTTGKNGAAYRQGFGWHVQLSFDGKYHNTICRDFCKAWKHRQRWLAERDTMLGVVSLPAPPETPVLRPTAPARPLALWEWADEPDKPAR